MGNKALRKKSRRILYKGSDGIIRKYAEPYLRDRLSGFDKDMKICLKGIPQPNSRELTHAYFPALMNCCGLLELLGGLYTGNTDSTKINRVFKYRKFLPQPDYSVENIRLLFVVLRHATAHLSTGSGVRIPTKGDYRGKRITWKIYADSQYPAIRLEKERDDLDEQSPWDCPHEYRLHVRLKRLQCDIRGSVLNEGGYLSELLPSKNLMRNFETCMRQIYPPKPKP